MSGAVLLRAHELVAGYHKRPVVGPIELTLRTDDTLALVGPNGVGKSTVLKTLAGLIPPVAGTVEYDTRSIAATPVHVHARRGLVVVGEHRANVLRTLTVEENLRLATGKRRAADVLDPVELFPRLGERQHQPAGTLSGGELQMLSLAMALTLAPRCLLLDEPSAGLAPIVLHDIRHALERLSSAGLCLIVAEQRPDVVHGLCHRIAVLTEGRLTYLEPGHDLTSDTLAAQYFGQGPAT